MVNLVETVTDIVLLGIQSAALNMITTSPTAII